MLLLSKKVRVHASQTNTPGESINASLNDQTKLTFFLLALFPFFFNPNPAPGAAAAASAAAASGVVTGPSAAVSSDASPEEAARARRLHQRFLFYFPRYDAHRAGQGFAERARDNGEIQARISQLLAQRPGLTALQTQWLLDGNDELILAQRALKWSYVLAYFQPEGPAKNLFEYSQQGLAEVTERLAELIEGTVVAQFKPQRIKEAVLHAKNMRMTLLKDIRSFFPQAK